MKFNNVRFLPILLNLSLQTVVGILITLAFCPECAMNLSEAWFSFAYGIAMTITLWSGNSVIQDRISKLIPWIKYPIRRFLTGMIVMILYTCLMVVVISYAYNYCINNVSLTYFLQQITPDYFYFALGITIFIALILHSRSFLIYWRKAAIEVEKLKREQLASQYRSLKDQLNPHFLFNSLNTLSALVYKDPDQATLFIRHLSSIYRYGLENAAQEAISLDKEIDFIQSYIHLLKIRFRDNLIVHMNVPQHTQYVLPPLSLQLLVENAVKHNVISSSNPLHLYIDFLEKGAIGVKNTLNRKSDVTGSTGIGLNNIRMRYKHLTSQEIRISETEAYFTVEIPLIILQKSPELTTI